MPTWDVFHRQLCRILSKNPPRRIHMDDSELGLCNQTGVKTQGGGQGSRTSDIGASYLRPQA
jgi:hypothetical protein